MIAVNINAGLANQMFHYAFGRGLMAKGLDICFDQSNFKPRKQWSFEAIQLQDAFPDIELKRMPEGRFRLVWLELSKNQWLKGHAEKMRQLSNLIGFEKYIMESSYGYQEGMERLVSRNCIYRGFWQSEKYFAHCKADIRKQFTFLPFDEPRNIEAAAQMSKENSVAIHLRKGKDYLESELMGKNLCGADYYMAAIDYIKAHVDHPVFYVFTDNPSWLKDNMPAFDYTLVDWNEVSGKRSFRDMQLMSCAKHNIIGNSTYSWWGAWLNPHPDKIVIAPDRFFNVTNDFFAKQDIVCEDWKRL